MAVDDDVTAYHDVHLSWIAFTGVCMVQLASEFAGGLVWMTSIMGCSFANGRFGVDSALLGFYFYRSITDETRRSSAIRTIY